jgi:hypothetical protein
MNDNLKETQKVTGQTGLSEDLRERLHICEKICDKIANLPQTAKDDYQAELDALVEEYRNAPTLPPEYAEIMGSKFNTACTKAKYGIEEFHKRNEAKQALFIELDKLVAAGDLVSLKEIEQLDKKKASIELSASDIALYEEKISSQREAKLAQAAQMKANEAEINKYAQELREMLSLEDITSCRARKQEIEAAYNALGIVSGPAVLAYQEALKEVKAALSRHYETLDFARWENYTLKLDICKEIEALAALSDAELLKSAKKLQDIRDKWKSIGSVPKTKIEEINARYLELTRPLQHHLDELFAQRRQELKVVLARKNELIAQAAQLAESTDWKGTAEVLKNLQAEWKTLARAGAQETELFAKFRSYADIFFNARSEEYGRRDKAYADAVEIKEALIAKAEALTLEEFRQAKQLREEFIKAPSAGRQESALRTKFDTIMQAFFDNRKAAFEKKEVQAKALLDELATLMDNPSENLVRYREIKAQLAENNCRNTFEAERKAIASFEKVLASSKELELKKEFVVFVEKAKVVSDIAKKAIAKEEFDVATLPDCSSFARLQLAVRQLGELAQGGDIEKFKKQLQANAVQRDKVIADLELVVGVENSNANFSLAQELEAAILGNFAKAQAAERKPREAQYYINAFISCGLTLPEDFALELDRFQANLAKLSK